MSDPLAEVMRTLRREYLQGAPQRVAELRSLLERVGAQDAGALDELRRAVHKLAGSGGSYGFEVVSTTSRAAEHLAKAILDRGAGAIEAADIRALTDAVEAIVHALDSARAEGEGPPLAHS